MSDVYGGDDDGDQGSAPVTDGSAGNGGYAPLDGSVNLTPPLGGPIVGDSGSGIIWHPLTDPALDQHYAGLANQYDPDPPTGLLGTFQQLPPDGVSDRWRYTLPNIPGEPMRDADGNPCSSWLVTKPNAQSGDVANSSPAGTQSTTTQQGVDATQVDPITVIGHRNLVDQLGDVAGKVWGAPNTVVGLGLGGLGYLTGLLAGTHPKVQFGNNAIQFTGLPDVAHTLFPNSFSPGQVLTAGNVQLYTGDETPQSDSRPYVQGLAKMPVGKHEEAHTYQSQKLGPFMLPLWLAGGGPSARNPFETSADRYGSGQGGPFSDFTNGPLSKFKDNPK